MASARATHILPSPLRAVCFDLDGTLLDSENFYFEIYREWLLHNYGAVISRDEFAYYETVLDDMLITHLLESGRLVEDTPKGAIAIRGEILAQSLQRFDELIESESARANAALLHSFRKRTDIPFALTTCSELPYVEPFLDAYALREVFSVILTGDQVTHKKPDPEVYHLALERLGLPGRQVVAVEDAPRGVSSALTAGMTVIRPLAYLLGHEQIPGALEVPDLAAALGMIG